MIDLDWLQERLVAVLKWQLANVDGADRADAPEVPIAGRRIWSIFLALNATRTAGMTANPISYCEIEAYVRLHRESLRVFELDILRAMDVAFLESLRAGREPESAPVTPTSSNAIMNVFRMAAAPKPGSHTT